MPSPSLDEFIAASKPLNPGASDEQLSSYWRDTYGAPAVSAAPSAAPSLDEFMAKAKPANPGASDESLKSYWDQTYKSVYDSQPGDTVKGFKRAFAQVPELFYGTGALAAMSAEHMFGEGGLSTSAKNYFADKYTAKTADNQKYAPSVEFTDAWDNLKQGNIGSMVDWLQDSAGYVVGQGLQTVATGGVGALVGKTALAGATQKMLGGVVAKQAAKIAEESAVKQGLVGAEKEAAIAALMPEATKLAAERTASAIGAGVVLNAQNLGMEAGDIYGGLTEESKKSGKAITGDDLLRAWGAAAAAAGTETATDMLGLGALTGRIKIGGKGIQEMGGVSGRVARGATAAAIGAPLEAAQEYVQTGLEQYGAGQALNTPEAQRERINAAAVGGLGGTVMGGGIGLIHGATPVSTPTEILETAAPVLAAGSVDEAIANAESITTGLIGSNVPTEAAAAIADGYNADIRLPELTAGARTQEQQLWMINQSANEAQAQKDAELDQIQRESRLPAALYDAEQANRLAEASGAVDVAEAPNAMQLAMQRARERRGETVETPEAAPKATSQPEWQAFAPESGTLGIPRADMPQVKAEHRGALVNFLNARGVPHQQEEVSASELKPTQAEFSPAKVEKAQKFEGGDRSILVSSDNHIVDGHHQSLAKAANGEPIQIIRLNAPIRDLLPLVHEFPSSQTADGATKAAPDVAAPQESPPAQPAKVDKILGRPVADIPLKQLRVFAERGGPRARPLAVAEIARRDQVAQEGHANAQAEAEQRNTPSRTFLRLVNELGGVKSSGSALGGAADVAGERSAIKLGGMAARVFKRDGHGIDYMATLLHEKGWLTDAEYADVDGGVQRVKDMLRDAIEGRLQPARQEDVDSQMEKMQADREAEEQAKADSEAIISALEEQGKLSSGQVSDEELDELFGPETRAANQEPAAQSAADGARTGEESDRQPLALESHTEKDVAAKESRAADESVADRERIKRESEVGAAAFNLTGDTKPASVANAEGAAKTSDLFAQPAKSAEFKPGDTVRVIGEKRVDTVESIGPDGWVYTRGGAANTPDKFERATPTAVQHGGFGPMNPGGQPTHQENEARWKAEAAAKTVAEMSPADLLRAAADKMESATPAPAVTTAPSKEDAGASAAADIQDFGEKIGGAKKDLWGSFKEKMDGAAGLDVATEPLSKTWPEPDYQKLLDNGGDAWAVAFMHAARDEIPRKPTKPWKLKGWVAQVTLLRDISMKLVDGTLDSTKARAMMLDTKTQSRGMSDVIDRVELYQLVGHSKSLAGVGITAGHYSLYGGIEYKPPKTIWAVSKEAKATAFSNWPRELATGATREEAIANFKEKYDSLDITQPKDKGITFEIYSKRGENGYYVGKKIGRNPALLAGPFATVKEARAYKADSHDELVAKLEKYKEIPNMRRDTNEPRVGEDMRNGQNVTPALFADTFGFRGVEFGNYVEGSKRQKDLNDAFDALMDMAAILGLPPKALSLNGELGLAFGARGTGGIDPAAAHYEPGFVVINLTKKEGAGSLGHEWWHALDNFVSRFRDKASEYTTESLDVSLAARGSNFFENTKLRKEMVAVFGSVVRAIKSTAIKARSDRLDGRRSKDYWNTGREMSARAFESYLISKLQDQNASNDYLVNIVDEETWKAAESLGWELDGTYPYPTAAEIPAIRAGFDELFAAVRTRQADGKVVWDIGIPTAKEVSQAVDLSPAIAESVETALTEDDKQVAAEELGAKEWNGETAKTFVSRYAEWVQQGAKDLGTKLSDLFKKVAAAVKNGLLSIAVAVNFNVAEPLPPVTATIKPQTLTQIVKRPRADFKGVDASADARITADWFVRNDKAGGKPFLIADKSHGVMYAFDADGALIAKAPALFGASVGDTLTDEQANKPIAQSRASDKITPAGVFNSRLEADREYGKTLTFANFKNSALAVHRVYLGTPSEKRMERLQSSSASDNRISYGCINALPEFVDNVLIPHFAGDSQVIVLPESSTAEEFFGINDSEFESKTVEATSDGRTAEDISWGGDKYALRQTPLFSRSQTATPEFKQWFGDSKVVDADGNPLRVFHGTATPSFTAFKRQRGGWSGGMGIWFGSDPSIANEFAKPRFADQGPAIYPVYLKVETPMEYAGWPAFTEAARATGKSDIGEMQRSLRNSLVRKGYDGIVIRGSDTDMGGTRDDWVVFEPTQIKSAVGNRGTFDASEKDIRFKRNPEPVNAGLTSAEVRSALAQEFGERTAKRLLDSGVITLLPDQSKLPERIRKYVRAGDTIYGFYDPVGDKTFAVLSNLKRDMVRGLVMHEVGVHYGFDRMLGPAKYTAVMKRLDRMHVAGNEAVREARAIATKESVKPGQIAEETLAYLVQKNPQMGIVREIIAAIKAFLFREFGIGGNRLTADDMTALAQAAVRHSAKEPVLHDQRVPAFHKAYHGSPHDFEKFTLDKIGTGEGAQAYGWGMYFAGKKEVAEFYKNKLAGVGLERNGARMDAAPFDATPEETALGYARGRLIDELRYGRSMNAEAIATAATQLADAAEETSKAFNDPASSKREAMIAKNLRAFADEARAGALKAVKGKLYEVELAPKEEDYLDWDKPLSEQSAKVRAALKDALDGIVNRETDYHKASELSRDYDKFLERGLLTGEQLYREIGERLSKPVDEMADGNNPRGWNVVQQTINDRVSNDEAASKYLADNGIPGIRYLDGSSRPGVGKNAVTYTVESVGDKWSATKHGTNMGPQHNYFDSKEAAQAWADKQGAGQHNYVIFDDKDVSIEAKFSRDSRTVEVDGVRRPITNSNGQPIAQTVDGQIAFWKWFGDSKVVDEGGRPAVVYHGTRSAFDSFSVSAPRGAPGNPAGIYFSPDRRTAEEYAQDVDGATDDRSKVVEAYIKIENDDDGLIKKSRYSGIQYIVFKPENVKSATDNSGQFDASNADIRFSRSVAGTIPAIQSSPNVAGYVSGLLQSSGKLGVLNGIATQYHKALMLERRGLPGFKQVFDKTQAYLNDVTATAVTAEQEAPGIFRELRGIGVGAIRKYFKGAATDAEIQAIQPALHVGTLFGGGNPMDGRKWTDDELKFGGAIMPAGGNNLDKVATSFKKELQQMPAGEMRLPGLFEPLTDKGIALYKEARAAIDRSLEDQAKSIIHRNLRKTGITFDKGMSLADVAQTVHDQLDAAIEAGDLNISALADQLTAGDDAANARIKKLFDKAMADNGDLKELKKTVTAVEAKANKLIEHGYMPLQRFGNRVVTAKDKDGKTQFVGFYDGNPLVPKSADVEMNKAAIALRRDNPTWTVTTERKSERAWELYSGLNLDALENFLDFLDPETKANLERDATIQEYMKNAVNSRSTLTRMVHRKGTPGFSTDIPRTLASFITSNARSASANYHGADMKALVEDIKEGDIKDEAADLVKYILEPKEEAAKLRSFLFFHFLGGSVAAGLVNLSQTPMMTAPALLAHANIGKVTAALGKAAKMAVQDPKTIPGAIGNALHKAELEGLTAPQMVHHLTAVAANNPFTANRQFRTFMTFWGGLFSTTEVFNRRVAFLAAYDIAMADKSKGDPYEFAKGVVNDTQLLYNKGNRPNLGRGALGATVLTFKTFTIGYLELLRRLPPKQQLMMLGMLVLAAGAEGLPFAEDIEDVVDTLGQWLGFNTNTGKWLGKTVRDNLGPEFERPILKGLGGMLPLDLHSRLGMGNIIPASSYFKQSEIDKTRDVAEAVGPLGGVLKNFSDSLQMLARGRWDKAAINAAPKAIRDAYNGAHMLATGEAEDIKGRKTLGDITLGEGLGKAVGFNSRRAAAESETKREIMQDKNLRTVRMDEIAGDWADGILRSDAEKIADARDRLRQWNLDNPELRIAGPQMMRSITQRVTAARMNSEQRFLKSVPKTMRQSAKEDLTR